MIHCTFLHDSTYPASLDLESLCNWRFWTSTRHQQPTLESATGGSSDAPLLGCPEQAKFGNKKLDNVSKCVSTQRLLQSSTHFPYKKKRKHHPRFQKHCCWPPEPQNLEHTPVAVCEPHLQPIDFQLFSSWPRWFMLGFVINWLPLSICLP